MIENAALGDSHVPEPRPGSILTHDGRRADLFNVRDYPVRAVCRICEEPIEADSYFRPFVHVEVAPATVYRFSGNRAAAGPHSCA